MFGVEKILKDGKCLLLAYDQGMEHGPVDFDDESVDPENILRIAKESGVFTGLVLQEGVAEKYYSVQRSASSVQDLPPLVLKLNGKTSFQKGEEPLSLQLCTVERAKQLGASAVGYTVYVGSEYEEQMMVELSRICDEAHAAEMPVIGWMYPRGKKVEGKETDKEVVAYAARLGLELGVEMVKLPFTGDADSFSWVVKSAGKTLVVVQGGGKKEEGEFLKEVDEIMKSGAAGMAVGRNVWQHEKPVEIAKSIAEKIWM